MSRIYFNLLIITTAFACGYFSSRTIEASKKLQMQISFAQQIEKIETEMQIKTDALNSQMRDIQAQYEQELSDERNKIKIEAQRANAAIADGRRLRDKYASRPSCKGSNSTASSNGEGVGESGELSERTSQFLISLAERADYTNEALKTCIRQYDALKAQFDAR